VSLSRLPDGDAGPASDCQRHQGLRERDGSRTRRRPDCSDRDSTAHSRSFANTYLAATATQVNTVLSYQRCRRTWFCPRLLAMIKQPWQRSTHLFRQEESVACKPAVRPVSNRAYHRKQFSGQLKQFRCPDHDHFVRRKVEFLATGIGLTLRAVRQEWQLSLREVEQRSLLFARERGNPAYQVSASWLARLEHEEHELTVNKLIVLAGIYSLQPEQLLRSISQADPRPVLLRQLSSPNATMLLTEGALQEQARHLLPDAPLPDRPPD
jgi:hypothetical protein